VTLATLATLRLPSAWASADVLFVLNRARRACRATDYTAWQERAFCSSRVRRSRGRGRGRGRGGRRGRGKSRSGSGSKSSSSSSSSSSSTTTTTTSRDADDAVRRVKVSWRRGSGCTRRQPQRGPICSQTALRSATVVARIVCWRPVRSGVATTGPCRRVARGLASFQASPPAGPHSRIFGALHGESAGAWWVGALLLL
jgi:hypothetical protein